MESRGGTVAALVTGDSDSMDYWRDISLATYPIYSAEPTLLKELARGNMAVVQLQDGVIVQKRTVSSLSADEGSRTFVSRTVDFIVHRGPTALGVLTLILAALLLLIGLPQWITEAVKWKLRKKSAESQN